MTDSTLPTDAPGPAPRNAAPDRPRKAMVLSAGYGRRLKPLTDHQPKPLLEIAGRPMVDHVLDRLTWSGVREVVVNAHHMADQIEAHFEGRSPPAAIISHEEELLDTGGGTRHALPHLGADPFFVVNSDSLWLDGPTPALKRLSEAWNDETMDALMLVVASVKIRMAVGLGDFVLDPLGQVARPDEGLLAPYVYSGIQIVHPRLFAGAPEGRYSFNRLWDRAIAADRLFAIVHDGVWFHVGNHEGLTLVRELFAQGLMRWQSNDVGP